MQQTGKMPGYTGYKPQQVTFDDASIAKDPTQKIPGN